MYSYDSFTVVPSFFITDIAEIRFPAIKNLEGTKVRLSVGFVKEGITLIYF